MKKLMALIALLMTLGVLTGCNTMQGLGKDIEIGGAKLQNSAKNAKDGK